MGWRAFVSAPAPNGVSVNDIGDGVYEDCKEPAEPVSEILVQTAIREGRRYVDLSFDFVAFHQGAEMAALRFAAPIFARYGMPVERIELEAREP